jgi:hypothetical protein
MKLSRDAGEGDCAWGQAVDKPLPSTREKTQILTRHGHDICILLSSHRVRCFIYIELRVLSRMKTPQSRSTVPSSHVAILPPCLCVCNIILGLGAMSDQLFCLNTLDEIVSLLLVNVRILVIPHFCVRRMTGP